MKTVGAVSTMQKSVAQIESVSIPGHGESVKRKLEGCPDTSGCFTLRGFADTV